MAGNRQENLEQAIACFQQALQVRTMDRSPLDHATTQNNLGNLYQQRMAGNRQENLEQAITCFHQALQVRTLVDFPLEHRDTHLNLAWLYADEAFHLPPEEGNRSLHQDLYKRAHQSYQAARTAQEELGWLESDELGRATHQGASLPLRELYARDAWCLIQLGNVSEAVVTLEAGRVQALVEAQQIAGVAIEGVCSHHRAAFLEARAALQLARLQDDRRAKRTTRDAFVAMRLAIRAHCQPDFLPGVPTYDEIAHAAAPDQALIYLVATDWGGLALVVPPANAVPESAARRPKVISLPQLNKQLVDDWLVYRESGGSIVGGYHISLRHHAIGLLDRWIAYQADDIEQARRRTLPLHALTEVMDPVFATLRSAVNGLCSTWQADSDYLSVGSLSQQQHAQELRRRRSTNL